MWAWRRLESERAQEIAPSCARLLCPGVRTPGEILSLTKSGVSCSIENTTDNIEDKKKVDQNDKKVYTIDDIARELGYSKTTVSRAISGKGRLSTQTRARVQSFIEEHNYRPNAVAKSLAKSRTYNLGVILPGDCRTTDSSFFQECLYGICELASRNDYDVLVTMDDGNSFDQLRRIIDNHKVDGLIATRSERSSPVKQLLKEGAMPYVVVGTTDDDRALYVDNNNCAACRDLVTLLISRGVRRMALLGGDENYLVTQSRREGFLDACLQFGLPVEEQMQFANLVSGDRVSAAIDEAVGRGADGVVCMDDYICNLALVRMQERGVRVPEDVKLACFYDNNLLEHTVPAVTSLRFDATELGRRACGVLLDLLEGRKSESFVLPGYQMMLRDSTE